MAKYIACFKCNNNGETSNACHCDEMPKTHKCPTCGGKGYTEYYYDAGDHFGAGKSPFSEWVKEPCKDCKPATREVTR